MHSCANSISSSWEDFLLLIDQSWLYLSHPKPYLKANLCEPIDFFFFKLSSLRGRWHTIFILAFLYRLTTFLVKCLAVVVVWGCKKRLILRKAVQFELLKQCVAWKREERKSSVCWDGFVAVVLVLAWNWLSRLMPGGFLSFFLSFWKCISVTTPHGASHYLRLWFVVSLFCCWH